MLVDVVRDVDVFNGAAIRVVAARIGPLRINAELTPIIDVIFDYPLP